ncbi:glycosyl hydrolase family 95 catalytic domain-containing protein [Actinospica sp.]|jgi:alpha-L-fucosidase 2|uniref:glycosyl hydrolase family 95 catalytic domain-containing protein n=1 Tax=Actinospica sp. TaxID=1872142 RepID=UPI002BE82B10|nr:glycoside hydrolase N-terminal domain-containing protein [Actinospica sp.]HWG27447.1 glycoside hydrolase N-terminal domain-containing protein [Actinospica sp.]
MSEQPVPDFDHHTTASRRDFLRLGGAAGAFLALSGLPVFVPQSAAAATARRPVPELVPPSQATTIWYTAPGTETDIIQQGLTVGNGRIGGLVTGDTADDALYLTDATLWTGGLNNTIDSGGQLPYDTTNFGTLSLLAKVYVSVPAHTASAISGYRRQLDLSNGYASASYQFGGVTYTREVYISHPDDVVVVRLQQSGGGSYTGTTTLNGTHGETTGTDSAGATASFSGVLPNGLTYGAAITAKGTGGTVSLAGGKVSFTGCSDVLIVIAGGTNYVPDWTKGFMDTTIDPNTVARAKAVAAALVPGDALLATHVADYQALYSTLTVNLGASTTAQRSLDTATRLATRAGSGQPDPELEAAYIQFGRYLMITCSRDGLPPGLQGSWLDTDTPAWMGDYHTDVNLEMYYWLPDRAGLSACFQPLTDYLIAQVPSWTATTQALYNNSLSVFANSSGKIAGWATAISANIYGGLGWWWHPTGNAWLCNTLFEHYQYTQDLSHLSKIYPLLKGACEFWEVRLIRDPTTGLLIDDADWSPEQGPNNAKGNTYSQELVWQLFQNYGAAAAKLGLDAGYAATIAGLQQQLYLPVVSPTTGWLEEWMTPDNLGETTHRHLSPLIGLFPGDRLTYDGMPADIAAGVVNLLTARGMTSFGWALAWRALCWARLKNAANAYQEFVNEITPSVNDGNGSSINLLDMYSLGSSVIFQIDGNLGMPSAALEMLLYSRIGLIELLPALPSAWANGSATGLGSQGGFTVDLAWTSSQVTSVTLHSAQGGATTVKFGNWTTPVTLAPGGSITLTPPPTTTTFTLTNRRSGLVLDDPNSSTVAGTGLVQSTIDGGTDQQWRLATEGSGIYSLTNVRSGLVADVSGGSTADGAAVIQYPDNATTNQRWTLADAGGGYLKIVNVNSGKLLSVQGDSTANPAPVVQTTDTGDPSQQWIRKPY